MPPSKVNYEIERALRQILDFFNVDCCGLMCAREDEPFAFLTHAYYAEHVTSVSKDINIAELFPWCYEKLILKREHVLVSRMTELPLEAEQDRKSWAAMKTKSNLAVYIESSQGNRLILTIHSVRKECDWPKEFVPRLILLGQIFVNAIERRDAYMTLAESESHLNLTADPANTGFWMLDTNTNIFWFTDKTRELFGFPLNEEISFELFLGIVHKDDREQIQKAFHQDFQTKEKTYIQYRIIRPDGRIRWIFTHGCIQFTESAAPHTLKGWSIDVTELKQKEDALCMSNARVASAIDIAGLGFYEMDGDGQVVFFNDRTRALIGIPPEQEHQGRDYWRAHIHPEDKPQVLKVSQKILEEDLNQYAMEYRFIHPSRGLVWFHHLAKVINRDSAGRAIRQIGVLRDITERKRYEEKLLDSQDNLRAFTRKLLTIQEEERRRLARELHDDFTQRLAVLAMDISKLEILAKSTDTKVKLKLRSIRDDIIKLSTDIHDVSRQLHPSIIDDLGLGGALRSECANFTQRMGIVIEYKQINIPAMIPRDISVVLFRITQEALRNIYKHAKAKKAEVCITGNDDCLTLSIIDTGAGFNPMQVMQKHGLGLFSMKERAQLIQGVLSIDSEPGRGTEIKVVVPLKRE